MNRILQPLPGPPFGEHYLSAAPGSWLWGRLPCATDTPVLEIEPGEIVTIDTVSHEGLLIDQGRDPVAYFARHGVPESDVLTDAVAIAASDIAQDDAVDGPHIVHGPIGIRGAQPGDMIAMTVLAAEPRVPYGIISNRHGLGALAGEYPLGPDEVSIFASVEVAEGVRVGVLPLVTDGAPAVRFPLAPFLGIMGVAVEGDERPNSVPPGDHGGNIDINLLVAGTTFFLPVQVPGALAYVGDPHFAQGDGEVALTAMEASLRVRIRFDLVPRADAERRFGPELHPVAETADFLVPTGMDEDLDEALRRCVRHAIALLHHGYGMDRTLAYAYLSAATDFTISQVVDLVKGVHARIRKGDFTPPPARS